MSKFSTGYAGNTGVKGHYWVSRCISVSKSSTGYVGDTQYQRSLLGAVSCIELADIEF